MERNSLSVVALAPLGCLEGLGQKASRSSAGGVKKNSPNAPVRGGTWDLAPSKGVEVLVTPSRRRGTPCTGAGGSGLRGPWAPWESSGEIILAMGEGLRGVGAEVWGTPSDGSVSSPWRSRHNSLMANIK